MRIKPILYYVYDPMCSWCYAFSGIWQQVKSTLEKELYIRYLVGGLAPDSNEPMPPHMQDYIKKQWQKIQHINPKVSFNYDFWQHNTPRRSTYPACRAVLAVRLLEPSLEQNALEIIQRYYYKEAKNPSDNSVLMNVARELNLDEYTFKKMLDDNSLLDKELELASMLGVMSFPSLILKVDDKQHTITHNYLDSDVIVSNVREYL